VWCIRYEGHIGCLVLLPNSKYLVGAWLGGIQVGFENMHQNDVCLKISY
jgi:hypothetical protein